MREYVRHQTGILLGNLAAQAKHTRHDGDAEAIHDLRVAIRRLRQCLRVFAEFYPGDSWKKLRRRLTDLMDACGSVRDCDIAMQLLAEAGVPAESALVRKLEAERRAAARELHRELLGWNAGHFKRHWRDRLEL